MRRLVLCAIICVDNHLISLYISLIIYSYIDSLSVKELVKVFTNFG